MRPIFKNTALNDSFQKDGFVSFPLLDEQEIAELKQIFEKLQLTDEIGYGYLVGMNSKSLEQRKQMQEILLDYLREKVESVLVQRQLYTATFMTKLPSDQNYVPPHQDWTYTEDEDLDPSFMCWLTLDTVEKANGALGFIRGSHQKTDYIRAFPFPIAPTPVERHKLELMDMIEIVEMRAGEIAFFDNRTIHASFPNLSSVNRLAIGMSAFPSDKRLVTYTLKPNSDLSVVEKWAVDPEFFVRYNNPALRELYQSGKSLEGLYEKLGEEPYEYHRDWNLEQTREWLEA